MAHVLRHYVNVIIKSGVIQWAIVHSILYLKVQYTQFLYYVYVMDDIVFTKKCSYNRFI